MELDIFIVDAFTELQYKGNSAAVIVLSEWLYPELMQKIASENNLSETAFIKEFSQNRYEIRWFSPLVEIDFCGHATLAASFVLFNYLGCSGKIEYLTREVGILTVRRQENQRIEMSFPNQLPKPVSKIPTALLKGLSSKPVDVLQNRQAYVVILSSEEEVRSITYQPQQLKLLAPLDVVVTAQSNNYDFVSRYFWPANGGDEDPVTGSIHAALAPYWAEKLSKADLIAYQASDRGGVLYCRIAEDRVLVSGNAVLYLRGKVFV